MHIGEIIKRWMNERGLSGSDLSQLSGVTQATIHRITTGESRDPRRSNIEKLAHVMGHTADEAYYLAEKPDGVYEEVSEYAASHVFVDIPYYRDTELSAGHGAVVHSEDLTGSLSFRRDWLRGLGLNEADLCVVKCAGESMEPNVRDGDIVLINQQDKTIRDGCVYALNYAGDARLKRLTRRFDGSLIIKSDNHAPEFSDELVTPELSDSLIVIGKAVWRGGLL